MFAFFTREAGDVKMRVASDKDLGVRVRVEWSLEGELEVAGHRADVVRACSGVRVTSDDITGYADLRVQDVEVARPALLRPGRVRCRVLAGRGLRRRP